MNVAKITFNGYWAANNFLKVLAILFTFFLKEISNIDQRSYLHVDF